MDLRTVSALPDDRLKFHRGSPYEHDETAVAGHSSLRPVSVSTYGKQAKVSAPVVVSPSVTVVAHPEPAAEREK